jgi:hypothetical protein
MLRVVHDYHDQQNQCGILENVVSTEWNRASTVPDHDPDPSSAHLPQMAVGLEGG